MNLNKVFLIGRLTRDPETKSLPSGQSLTSFGLATGRFYTDKSGQKQQQTEFHNIVLFGKLAEIGSQFLAKGSLVMIEGRIQTRSWQDSTGSKKYKTEVIGEGIQLGPRSAGTGRTTAPREKGNPPEEIPVVEEQETEEINVEDIPF